MYGKNEFEFIVLSNSVNDLLIQPLSSTIKPINESKKHNGT